jgi:hypothetical protein
VLKVLEAKTVPFITAWRSNNHVAFQLHGLASLSTAINGIAHTALFM